MYQTLHCGEKNVQNADTRRKQCRVHDTNLNLSATSLELGDTVLFISVISLHMLSLGVGMWSLQCSESKQGSCQITPIVVEQKLQVWGNSMEWPVTKAMALSALGCHYTNIHKPQTPLLFWGHNSLPHWFLHAIPNSTIFAAVVTKGPRCQICYYLSLMCPAWKFSPAHSSCSIAFLFSCRLYFFFCIPLR